MMMRDQQGKSNPDPQANRTWSWTAIAHRDRHIPSPAIACRTHHTGVSEKQGSLLRGSRTYGLGSAVQGRWGLALSTTILQGRESFWSVESWVCRFFVLCSLGSTWSTESFGSDQRLRFPYLLHSDSEVLLDPGALENLAVRARGQRLRVQPELVHVEHLPLHRSRSIAAVKVQPSKCSRSSAAVNSIIIAVLAKTAAAASQPFTAALHSRSAAHRSPSQPSPQQHRSRRTASQSFTAALPTHHKLPAPGTWAGSAP